FFFPIGERTASMMSASGIENRVDAPGTHTFELVLTPILEGDPRAGDEVLHRARDDHLARSGERGNTGTRADDDAGDLSLVQLALAGVHACAKLETECPDATDDLLGAPDGAGGPVEGGEEPVARGVALGAAEAGKLPPDESVVPLEELAPCAVAELTRSLRGADDVR